MYGNSLQYSCLGNAMDREAWQATVHGVAKELDTTDKPYSILLLLCLFQCISFSLE